jgi:hypothetical protein
MSIYMLNKFPREPEIFASKFDPFVTKKKRLAFSPKFWLWSEVPKNWQVARGFMLWCFLSWGVDYRIKKNHNPEESLFWAFNHPISPCVMDSSLQLKGLWVFCINSIQIKIKSNLKNTKITKLNFQKTKHERNLNCVFFQISN